MEALLIIIAVLGGLVLLDVLAVTLGADSRDSIADDWRRPASA
jgi:hypothetical protein